MQVVTPSSKSVLQLETKLEAISGQLEKLSRAISTISSANADGRYSNTKPRRQAHPYQQPQVELLALPAENLAPRLGLTPSALVSEKEKLSPKEFISWTRNRDPRGLGWEFHKKDELYHPVK